MSDEQDYLDRLFVEESGKRERSWMDTRLNLIVTKRIPATTTWRGYPQVVRLQVVRGGGADGEATVLLTRPIAWGLIRDLIMASWKPARRWRKGT